MRISDWSSDVCSSDLLGRVDVAPRAHALETFDDHAVARGHARTHQPVAADAPADFQDTLLDLIVRADEQGGGFALAVAADGALRHQEAIRGYALLRSEEHTSELQSLMRISYAGF